MKDLYLKCTDKSEVDAIINPLLPEGEQFGNYFQNQDFALDYIGKVPKIYDEETGDVTEWWDGERFNVRLITEDVYLFNGFESITPEIPFRKFA